MVSLPLWGLGKIFSQTYPSNSYMGLCTWTQIEPGQYCWDDPCGSKLLYVGVRVLPSPFTHISLPWYLFIPCILSLIQHFAEFGVPICVNEYIHSFYNYCFKSSVIFITCYELNCSRGHMNEEILPDPRASLTPYNVQPLPKIRLTNDRLYPVITIQQS